MNALKYVPQRNVTFPISRRAIVIQFIHAGFFNTRVFTRVSNENTCILSAKFTCRRYVYRCPGELRQLDVVKYIQIQ